MFGLHAVLIFLHWISGSGDMHHLKTTELLIIEQLMVDVNDFASQSDQESVKEVVKISFPNLAAALTTEVQRSGLNSSL